MSEKQEQKDPTTESIPQADLVKGLARLERLAKSQVTGKLPGNNEPKGSWAYGEEPTEVSDEDSDVSGDSGEDERAGKKSDTDYKPKSSPVRKAMDRDDDENDGGGGDDDDEGEGDDDPFADDDGPGEDGKDEGGDKKPAEDKDTEKSFAARVRASKHIRSGVEVSPFLRDTVTSINKSFRDLERRTRRFVRQEIHRGFARQQAFNKSLSEALSGLGAVAIEQSDLIKAISAQPARGPKSQTHAVRPVQKSFDGGEDQITLPDGSTAPQLERGVILQRLLNGVAKNLIGAGEVVKFETTGIVSPALYKSLCTNPEFVK